MTGPTFCTDCKRMRHLGCRKCLDRARSQVMERIGLLLFLVFLALGFASGAHAADTYRIHCGEFTTAEHRALDRYISDWFLQELYGSESSCDAGAQDWVDTHYHGNVLDDGSRVLVQCWCERVKP